MSNRNTDMENADRITKTCLYNFDPLKPHFYIVKLGFTRVYIIFLISAQKHRWRGGSNECPQSMLWAEIWKIPDVFYLIFFYFLVVKFSVYLNRHVSVIVPKAFIWQQCQKAYLLKCAPSEYSDQTAHSSSLIRIFPVRILDSQGCKLSSRR